MIKLTIRSDYCNDIILYFQDTPDPDDVRWALDIESQISLYPSLVDMMNIIGDWEGEQVFKGIRFDIKRVFVHPVRKDS